MSYYQQHLFFCLNQRTDGRRCCAANGSEALCDYAKRRLRQLGLHGPGQVRVNRAGCLDRCQQGPVLVIYPEGVWYQVTSEADVDHIIDTHILGKTVVAELQLPPLPGGAPSPGGESQSEKD